MLCSFYPEVDKQKWENFDTTDRYYRYYTQDPQKIILKRHLLFKYSFYTPR